MPHAQLDGRRLFYDEAGEGEPLLLVQGMSGTRLSWGDPFLAALHEGGFATVAYDHRDAAGFIKLNALRLRMLAQRKKKLGL